MSSARASRVYVGRIRSLERRPFIRHLRYLQRDGRHAALLVWNGESLDKEAAAIDTLASTLEDIHVTTLVASWGDKRAAALSALRTVRDSLRASGCDVRAAILVAHGLPQEDTMRHVHAIIASREPIPHRRILSFLQERWNSRGFQKTDAQKPPTSQRQQEAQSGGARSATNRFVKRRRKLTHFGRECVV